MWRASIGMVSEPTSGIVMFVSATYLHGMCLAGKFAVADGADEPDNAQRRWTNLNRFLAHLGAQQEQEHLPLNLREILIDLGVSTINKGLGNPSCGNREVVEAAAAWLSIAGRQLRQRLSEGEERDTCWAFWKQRLCELLQPGGLEDGVVTGAAKVGVEAALKEM
jgi:hypothetical protein